jgi:hypothetical protein
VTHLNTRGAAPGYDTRLNGGGQLDGCERRGRLALEIKAIGVQRATASLARECQLAGGEGTLSAPSHRTRVAIRAEIEPAHCCPCSATMPGVADRLISRSRGVDRK